MSTKESVVSSGELCKILSISDATLRNWLRLNKIQPSYSDDFGTYFSKKYVSSFVKKLNSDKSEMLKSRRNKKYLSGSSFYNDYIEKCSPNLNTIISLSEYIRKNNIIMTEQQINYILADCALKLLTQRLWINNQSENIFIDYLNNKLSQGNYNRLIEDLVNNREDALVFVKQYPEIFKIKYMYKKNEDILGLLYQSLSDIKSRKSSGSYYTPAKIVNKVITQISVAPDKTILDPCCGSGNFLLQLSDNMNISNIYGNDVNPTAIKLTRINMALEYNIDDIGVLYKNFTNKNFLTEENNRKYDYVIGNPPWGAEFSDKDVNIIRRKYTTAGKKNIESYDVFIEKSLSSLNKNGNMIFVLPEAVLSVKAHNDVRKIILKNNSVINVEFLGNIFDKVQCPSIILNVQNTNAQMSYVGAVVTKKYKSFVINKEREITPDLFCFSMTDEEYEIYQKIYLGGERKYLKNNAVFALGIVTGDNKKYISDKKTVSNELVLKGSDIEKYRIKAPLRYIEYIPENFQQVAPTDIYRAKEKLFYKFISNKLIFAYDDSQMLSLNSCNILIPKIEGMNIKYVMAVLNSRIAQFIFEKKYNSVKVLRSHLENIPIPVCVSWVQNKIINIADDIMTTQNRYSDLYEELDKLIAALYGITDCEYNIIKGSLSH